MKKLFDDMALAPVEVFKQRPDGTIEHTIRYFRAK
jgi:hypothetical protein